MALQEKVTRYDDYYDDYYAATITTMSMTTIVCTLSPLSHPSLTSSGDNGYMRLSSPYSLSTTTGTAVGYSDHRKSYYIITHLSQLTLPSTNPSLYQPLYLPITYTHRYSSGAR